MKTSARDGIPYTDEAMKQDLIRVRNAWDECQASRDRNAIYGYLSAVFDLVMWWKAEDRAVSRAPWALQLQRLDLPTDEPFAAIIRCTSDPGKVDKRTRSKWSRVLRYSAKYMVNRSISSFAAKVESTSVRSDLPVVLGEAVVAEARNRSSREWQPHGLRTGHRVVLVRLVRRRKHAIRTLDVALRQLRPYSLRLLFHAHPAQFAD
jgi:hypothetical protein